MEIPETVMIGSYTYKVTISEKEDPNMIGFLDRRAKEIWIEKKLPAVLQEETLLCKILEALNYIYSLNLGEFQLIQVAATLFNTLKRNNLLR